MAELTDSTFYVTGGTLRQDAACYVERQADKDLLDGLLKGEFCYVLTSRQMGKSSLMVRTAGKLREQGVRVAVLDLTAVGQPESVNCTPLPCTPHCTLLVHQVCGPGALCLRGLEWVRVSDRARRHRTSALASRPRPDTQS